MTFDIQKILQSKGEFRRGLAALPIEEKLRLLDDLRERQLAIRERPSSGAPLQRKNAVQKTEAHESHK